MMPSTETRCIIVGPANSRLGRIQRDPVAEFFGMPADPGSHVSVRRAPDLVVFYQNTQPFERFAHDPESVFLVLQERVEEQCQVPAIPDYALQRDMHAIVIERFGDPSELRPTESPRPQPQVDEVLVEVHAAAVNRSDVLNARGSFPFTTLPRIPGRDFAGVVVEGPDDLVGKEVWGTGGGDLGFVRDGSHARYLAVPTDAVAPKSREISLEEAAVSGLAYVTAASAFTESGGISTGETILVTGAAGGVGSAAVMIARWKGARVIGAIEDQTERARAERAGVEVIVDTSREDARSRTPLIQVAQCRTRQYTVLTRKLR